MRLRATAAASLLVSLSLIGRSQEPLQVSNEQLQQHVIRRSDPVYPAIAKAIKLQDTVQIEITIDELGKPSGMKVVSGNPMLQQAALDALKKWTFQPFQRDGKPTVAVGRLSIVFSLGIPDDAYKKDREIGDRYFKAQDECHAALAKRDNSPEAGVACKRAAEIADEFAPDSRFIERRSSYVYAAWALANCQGFKTALTFANKAVTIVQLGHDDNSGTSAAYGIRGIVEGDLNDRPASDRDLTTAEDYGRKAIEWAKEVNFEHADSYRHSLAMYLRLHSALLEALNRPEDAKQKLEEAESLR